jgi:NADPH:quinone reductase-like Zn-dependent oxidoreductase
LATTPLNYQADTHTDADTDTLTLTLAMAPTNTAAWLTTRDTRPLEVKEAPYTPPDKHQIVIKTKAIALNPIDPLRQDVGSDTYFPWTTYPMILGVDVAGEVVEVGSGVSRFKPGDRVMGLTNELRANDPAQGSFQAYVVLLPVLTAPIPDNLSFEEAATIPLGASTAACGMFQKDYLAMQLPTVPARPSTGETVLIWSGASSVGSNAIQLAVAAGYDVITTCSPKNFGLVKSLGASQAFDYHSPSIVDDIVKAFEGKTCAGSLAICARAPEICALIMSRVKGKRFVALANMISKPVEGVETNYIFGSDLKDNEVGPAIFEHFLPKALAAGSYVPAPPHQVIGHGLEWLQRGMDMLIEGVSAKKLVVTL